MVQKRIERDPLLDMARTDALYELSLLDDTNETVYDYLTRLAGNIIGAPISQLSMISSQFQFTKSSQGMGNPTGEARKTPLSHSFCKHVVRTNEPLIVGDARENVMLKYNPSVQEHNAIGYLGIPLTLQDGNTLGSFCVVDHTPREWTEAEIAIMTELAQIVTLEFDARAYVRRKKMSEDAYEDLQARIVKFADELDVTADQPIVLSMIRKARVAYGLYELAI